MHSRLLLTKYYIDTITVARDTCASSPKHSQTTRAALKGSVCHVLNQGTFSETSYYTTASFGEQSRLCGIAASYPFGSVNFYPKCVRLLKICQSGFRIKCAQLTQKRSFPSHGLAGCKRARGCKRPADPSLGSRYPAERVMGEAIAEDRYPGFR